MSRRIRQIIAVLMFLTSSVALTGTSTARNIRPNGATSNPCVVGFDQIAINSSVGPYYYGSNITFFCGLHKIKGYEYPMVSVSCVAQSDGHALYAQLDHPDSTQFVLGTGSVWSSEPDTLANCTATLWVYPGPEQPPAASMTFSTSVRPNTT